MSNAQVKAVGVGAAAVAVSGRALCRLNEKVDREVVVAQQQQ